MSPILSNIFQNDLHDIFQGSDPIKMGDIHFNSLSWADDLLLLSTSESGLQSCLNQLQNYCRQWGLTINTKKTKSMVFSSSRWTPTKMFIGDTPIECVKNFQYLGFHISYNMKFKNLIADREAKAMKMANMVHRALRTSNNVSIKLSMSLLDKQITPILLYGSAVWGLPDTHNLIYLEDQPQSQNTRTAARNVLKAICGYDVPFSSVRRVGKNQGHCRSIMIRLKNIQDKEIILRNTSSYRVSDFRGNTPVHIDKFQSLYCKKSLNVSKYASNVAVLGELGRFPIMNNVWAIAVKYWLRLVQSTANTLLNAAFETVCLENHNWLQGIYHCLTQNGFRNIWFDPPGVNSNFHVVLKQRLNDQYIQSWRSKIGNSSRFTLLKKLKTTFDRSVHIDRVRNPVVRLVLTHLRIDMNVYSTYNNKNDTSTVCPICKTGNDSLCHLLFHCSHFINNRKNLYRELEQSSTNWKQINDEQKLLLLLDMQFSDSVLNICCKYISDLYKVRKKCKTWEKSCCFQYD